MNVLIGSILIALCVVTVAVIIIAIEVIKCRRLLSDVGRTFARGSNVWPLFCSVHQGHEGRDGEEGCFLVWEWRDGRWCLMPGQPPTSAAAPPESPGAYDGDLAKTWVSKSS